MGAEHKEDEHLDNPFYTKSRYTRFKMGSAWNDSP